MLAWGSSDVSAAEVIDRHPSPRNVARSILTSYLERAMVAFRQQKPFMETAWTEFSGKIIPTLSPGNAQYDDMQSVFYAGALHIMDLCEALGDEDIGDDLANVILGDIHEDIKAFFTKKIAEQNA